MNFIDLLILLFISIGGILGIWGGLIYEILTLTLWFFALWAAYKLKAFLPSPWGFGFIFFLILASGYIVLRFLKPRTKLSESIESILGALIGIFKGALLSYLLLLAIKKGLFNVENALSGSLIAPLIFQSFKWLPWHF